MNPLHHRLYIPTFTILRERLGAPQVDGGPADNWYSLCFDYELALDNDEGTAYEISTGLDWVAEL